MPEEVGELDEEDLPRIDVDPHPARRGGRPACGPREPDVVARYRTLAPRWSRRQRPEKQRILDEFCAVTKQHRKHAIRLLNGPTTRAPRPRRARPVQYGRATIAALQTIWEAAGYPRSVRLKALLPLWLPWARRRLALRPS